MKKIFILGLLALGLSHSHAQNKKVAVVTFYADKMVDLSDMGLSEIAAIADLQNDPDFNLTPIVEKYHTKFFNEYAKKFPFELVPETTVTSNADYKAFQPTMWGLKVDMSRYQPYPGYQALDPFWNNKMVQGVAKTIPDVDGILFVFINFSLNKGFGVGGTATTKMQAYTHIALYNKNGDKVFVISEHANSKKTGVMVGGVPVMKTEKILPMCEDALNELMADLDKRIQKIIDKSGKKL